LRDFDDGSYYYGNSITIIGHHSSLFLGLFAAFVLYESFVDLFRDGFQFN
jgi:hypothetical protein